MKEPHFGDRASIEAERSRRPRGAPPPLRWQSARGQEMDAALCRTAHRLARPRPRVGDGGPIGARLMSRGPPARSIRTKRSVPTNSRSRSPPSRSPRPDSAQPLAAPGRPYRPPTSTACGHPDEGPAGGGRTRVVPRDRALAPAGPGSPSRGAGPGRGPRGPRPAARRRRRRRSRTSSCRGGRGSADRRLARRRPHMGLQARPSRTRARHRARPAGLVRSPRGHDNRPDSRHRTTHDRWRPPMPRDVEREQSQP